VAAQGLGYQAAAVAPQGATAVPAHPGAGRLYCILTIVIIGFFASLFYHYAAAATENKHYPYNTFLFIPQDEFMDFYNNFVKLKAEGAGKCPRRLGERFGTLRARLLFEAYYPKHHTISPRKSEIPPTKGRFWRGPSRRGYFWRHCLRLCEHAGGGES